jgi:hypothetical protein
MLTTSVKLLLKVSQPTNDGLVFLVPVFTLRFFLWLTNTFFSKSCPITSLLCITFVSLSAAVTCSD